MRRAVWFAGGVAAGAAGAGYAKRKVAVDGADAGAGERRPRRRSARSAAPGRRVADAVREGRQRRPGPRARAARRARRAARAPRRPPPARRRGARRRRAGRVGPGDPDAPSRARRWRDRVTAVRPALVADLRRALGARPGARRRDRAVALPPRRLAHGGRRRRRVLPDVDRRGPGVRATSPTATACRSSPAARAPASPAGRCRRTGRRHRDDEDEPHPVGRPAGSPGVGRAGRAQPRPHPGRRRRTACTSRPTRAASRRARSAATSPTTRAGRTASPRASRTPTSSPSRSCCPTAASPCSAARIPSRPGYDLRGVFVGSEGMFGDRHQGVRAPDAGPAGDLHDADGLRLGRGRRVDRQRGDRRRDRAGGDGDDGPAVPAGRRGVHPRRAAGRRRGGAARRGRRAAPRRRGRHASRSRAIAAEHGVRTVRVAADDAERALLWKGRKSAFGAIARIKPNYYLHDTVVPRRAAARRCWRRCTRSPPATTCSCSTCSTPATATCTRCSCSTGASPA